MAKKKAITGEILSRYLSSEDLALLTRLSVKEERANSISNSKGYQGMMASSVMPSGFKKNPVKQPTQDQTSKKSTQTESKKRSKKDPDYSSVAPGIVRPLKFFDSVADILGKMYNFMTKSGEVYKLNDEIERSFRQEQLDEDGRRHKELVKSIHDFMKSYKRVGKEPEEGKDKDSGFMDFLKHFVEGEIIFKLVKWAGGLIKGVVKFALGTAKFLGKFVLRMAGLEAAWQGLKSKFPKVFGEPKPVPGKGGAGVKGAPGEVTPETDKKGKIRYRDKGTGRYAAKPNVPKVSKVTKALKAAKGVLKVIGKIPLLSTIAGGVQLYEDVEDAIEEHEDGGITDTELKKRITEAVGGALGGIGGAELGAAVGATMGSIVPVVGTAIGGIAGGVGGFLLGVPAGKYLAGQAFDYFENADEKQISEKIDNAIIPPIQPKTPIPETQTQTRTGIPASLENQLGLSSGESVVSVNNSVNNIGGKPSRVLSTNTAKQRNSDLDRFLSNSSVVV